MKFRLLVLGLLAIAGIAAAGMPASAGGNKFYITNNGPSRIKWLTLVFHLSNGSTAQHRYPVRINQRVIESITVPDQVKTSGRAIDVSSVCTIDVGIGYAIGSTVWARGYDVCNLAYIEALDTSASAYSNSKYTTPRPDMTPDASDTATPEPDPDPQDVRTPAQEAFFRGGQLEKRGNYSGALAYYNRGLRLDPRNVAGLISRGNAYYTLNRFARAIADFDAGLRIDVQDGVLHFARGNAEWANGMLDAAVEDYRAASQYELILENSTIVGVIAARVNGDAPAARALLEACTSKCKTHGPLGREVEYLRGALPGRDLINTATSNTDRTEAHALVGFSALSRGKKGEARPHFQWIVKNANADDAWRPIVRAQLAKMR